MRLAEKWEEEEVEGEEHRQLQSVKRFRQTQLENITMKISELSESYCASDINKILKTLHTRKT